MIKDGKIHYDEIRDRKFRIAESVCSFYPIIYATLYEEIKKNSKLEVKRTKSKEEIIKTIKELLIMGLRLDHSLEPSDKMKNYFFQNFDTECRVEFLNRERRTFQWPDRRHDYNYIEQDLPLASDEDIERITRNVFEIGQAIEKVEEARRQEKKLKRTR